MRKKESLQIAKKVDIPPDGVIMQVSPAANGQPGQMMNSENGHAEPVDKEEPEPEVKLKASVGFFQLFKYATGFDKFLMILGTITAMGMGCAIPVNLLIYGEVLDRFIENAIPVFPANGSSALPPQPLGESIDDLILYFVAIGIAVIILGYLEIACWTMTAERQTRRIRALCYKSILKQHIGWFDVHETGELNTRLTDDINKIQSGIGDKFAMCIQWVTTFIAGYIIGFIRGWQLTLVIISVAPILVIAIALLQFLMQRITKNEQAAYAKAGAVAEEVLSAIRTVYAFGGKKKKVPTATLR